MTVSYILAFLVQEFFLARLFITVIVSFQSTGHAKVVDEERMLVDVLKDTELALVEG